MVAARAHCKIEIDTVTTAAEGSSMSVPPHWRPLYRQARERAETAEGRAEELKWAEVVARTKAVEVARPRKAVPDTEVHARETRESQGRTPFGHRKWHGSTNRQQLRHAVKSHGSAPLWPRLGVVARAPVAGARHVTSLRRCPWVVDSPPSRPRARQASSTDLGVARGCLNSEPRRVSRISVG